MRKIYTTTVILLGIAFYTKAQTNTFPTTGNVGIGTLSPASSLQVVGASRFGSASNYMQIDASGNLGFVGTPGYKVAGNKYAFQYSGNTNYGLFFNSTSVQYEFRNGSAVPVFLVNANSGNSVFSGTVKVGAYTLPATDGLNGQTLKTNGVGVLTWSADNNSSYTPGTGISIAGNIITNSEPDKTVVLTAGSNIAVTGTYPNFTIAGTAPAGWSLGGNNGTNSSTQFIGTTDAKALTFKVNNIRAGFIEADELKDTTAFGQYTLLSNTGNQNTAVGYKALYSNSTGFDNVSVGSAALLSNTTGNDNTASGFQSLNSNSTGSFNTAHGSLALSFNTAGTGNTGGGYASLFNNTTGSSNTAMGSQALYANSTGSLNTAVGSNALHSNSTGFNNVSAGSSALYANTTGNDNTATGFQSLNSNSTGSFNTANGSLALSFNTTGTGNTATGYASFFNNTTGNNNTANGNLSLYSNSTGYSNVAIGVKALYSNTVGHNLVAVGDSALYNQSFDFVGTYGNTAVGSKALFANTIGSSNTATGAFSLSSSTTGYSNTANGYNAMLTNSTGSANTASGVSALYGNTTGNSNVAYGLSSLASNNTGNSNTAIGTSSLLLNTTGYSNVAIGVKALNKNTDKSNLVAVGDSALYNNGTGAINTSNATWNTAIGSKTLYFNTTGSSNTAVGYNALYSNTTGVINTATGAFALYYNSSGGDNVANGNASIEHNTTGSKNVGMGDYSLYNNVSGNDNNAIGYDALFNNVGGNDNIALGSSALANNNSGNNNTAIGFAALITNTAGTNNTALGLGADVTINNLTNATAIGNGALVNASNKVRIGNTVVNSIGGQVGWSTFSDGRYKKNIKEDVKGLAFINLLHPITYTVDINGLNEYYDQGRKHDSSYKKRKEEEALSTNEASGIVYNGFIAQDVEVAAKKLNYVFSGVDKPTTKDGLYGLRYAEFVVPLVKAVQELSTENDDLKKENAQLKSANNSQQSQMDQLQSQLAALMLKMNKLEQVQEQCCSNALISVTLTDNATITSDAARLEQNIPNPFKNNTIIPYYIPSKVANAQVTVNDMSGHVIKKIAISGKGKGQINLSTGNLAAGNYLCTLITDGIKVCTIKMLVSK